MKPEIEALYEGLCRREPDLFEPESLHKQLDALTSAVSNKALEALLQLCEDWQKHAFAVGFTAAVRLLTNISTACRPLMGVWIEIKTAPTTKPPPDTFPTLSPLTQGRGLKRWKS